jgi:hypothetical protein
MKFDLHTVEVKGGIQFVMTIDDRTVNTAFTEECFHNFWNASSIITLAVTTLLEQFRSIYAVEYTSPPIAESSTNPGDKP